MKTRPTRKTTPKPAHRQAGPQPERTPREENILASSEVILLAVTGMSPAVLTETIWALANPPEETAPIIPHRIIVVTTTEGRSRLQSLFEPSPQLGGVTPWDALRAALAQRGHDLTGRLRFGSTSDDIRVITAMDPVTSRTRELPDIRDLTDNEAAADFLLEQVRAIVENPDTQLIASIAGGRKTMSALLYACLTLVGRETDRLTHVLVNEPFESLRDFWFPEQPGGPLLLPAGSAGSARSMLPKNAKIQLADVPFVALRNLFERELARKPGSFLRLVEACRAGVRRRAAENLRISLDTTRAELEINGQIIKLAPTEMLLAYLLARQAKHGEPSLASYKLAVEPLNTFREEQIAAATDWNDWRTAPSLRDPWDEHAIAKALSSLRAKLRGRGPDAALLAQCLPEKGRFSLDVPGPMIFIK